MDFKGCHPALLPDVLTDSAARADGETGSRKFVIFAKQVQPRNRGARACGRESRGVHSQERPVRRSKCRCRRKLRE